MARFEILNEVGEVENTIVASLSFVEANYTSFKEVEEPTKGSVKTKEEEERAWRNSEIVATDWIVPVVDHPQHSEYLTYRQALRDWPSTEDFPDTRPTL